MTIKNIENMTAVQNANSHDVIGYLMWYSVGKQLIKSNDLHRKLVDSGLSESWMPNVINERDAFKRATRDINNTRRATNTPGVFHNYLVREVYLDEKIIQRNIVVERVDQSGKKLDYDSTSCIVTFNRDSGTISTRTTDGVLKELCEEIEKNFSIYKTHYAGEQLRAMVSKILQSFSPTPVRPNGGVYFVPAMHTEGLNQLLSFTSSLENSEGFKTSLVNTADDKKLVNTKLKDHMDALLNSCKSSLGLSKPKVKAIINEAKVLINDYKSYTEIVADESDDFENKILQIRKEVSKMIDNMG